VSTGRKNAPSRARVRYIAYVRPTSALRPALAAALAMIALAGCGAATGLIPPENAGHLEHDFEEVARAASAGECSAASEMLERTESDFQALPASVAHSLRGRLRSGIAKLREDALAQCAAHAQRTTSLTTTSSRTSTTTTTSSAETLTQTSSQTSTSESTSATTTGEPTNGGTPVPEENHETPAPGAGAGAGAGEQGAPAPAQPPHGAIAPGARGPAR
jgi:hypothetical protein